MSAICGVIHYGEKAIANDTTKKMLDAYKKYPMDQIDTLERKRVSICCFTQKVLVDSYEEEELIIHEEDSTIFAADCMIDNRDELISLLGIRQKEISDSRLLYLSYKKWNIEFADYVCGIFSFVVYNAITNRTELYTDHTGSRCLYYMYKDQTLYFSTITDAIITAYHPSVISVEDKFIVGCLATSSADMFIFPGVTAFHDVYQIPAGHYVQVYDTTIQQLSYWNPYQNKKKQPALERTIYKEQFLCLLKKCVKGVLRSCGETGMTLSSGLDSSAVACTAAPLLQLNNRNLYSFTSVPLTSYKNKEENYYVVNESFGPKEICKKYPNLVPTFVPCENRNAFTDMEDLIDKLELPYKSAQNMVWIEEIYQMAEQRNIRVMLKGQYGNATISYGNILTRINSDLHHMKFLTAVKEFRHFAKRNRVGKKDAIKGCFYAVRDKIYSTDDVLKNTIVKSSLLRYYKVSKAIKTIRKSSGGTIMDSAKQRRDFLYYLQGLAQLGAYDTRLGLMHKLIIRDPLKDKRLLEFCAMVPMDCLVHHGIERAMVRLFMQGIIPQSILSDLHHRGLQSADFMHRIALNWREIYLKVSVIFDHKDIKRYCSERKLTELRQRLVLDHPPEENDLIQVMHLYSVTLFLNHYRMETTL